MSHCPIRFENILIIVTSTALLLSLWHIYKPKIKRLRQRLKLYLPRKWKPKSPKDCPGCMSGIELAFLKSNQDVIPYAQRKSNRGRSKHITAQGFACPIQTVTTSASPTNTYTQSSVMANAGLIDIFNTGNVSGVTNASPAAFTLPFIA